MCPRGRPQGQGRLRGLHLCKFIFALKESGKCFRTLFLGVVKYKLSALFRNLCNSCMSVRALLLLSCVHSLGLGLVIGNSLDRTEEENARAFTHESQSCQK